PVPARVRPLHGLALLTVIMATATGIGLGLGGGGRVTSQEPNGLRVERRSPDDGDTEVTTDAALLVQFNASVQRLAPNETLSPDVLRIDPGPAGVGAWLTSSMYRFRPAEGWQPSTRYTVTVAPGLKDVEGRPLAGPESWSFTTVYPAVADVTPGPDTNQAPVAPVPGREPPPPGATPQPSAAPVNGAITVRFNQPVERAAAQAALRFTPPISGAFSWNDDRTLVLQPSAPLAVATKYEGVVAEGVPSAVNPAAVSAAPFTWSFTTAGPAGVSGSEPTALSVTPLGGTVRLTFATPMDKATVDERISVEPKPDNGPFTFFEPGETRLHINFPSKPSTQYTVTLAAGATDRFGQTIDEPFSLTFTTAALRPALTVLGAGRGGAFLAGGQSRVVLSGVNLPAADITLYRIDRAQFQSQLNFGSIRLTPPDGAAEQRRQRVAFPDPELNRTRFATVDLTDAGPLPAGYYLLWATGGEGPPQQLPFVVTGAHLTLKRSADELLVWALDYTTGAPLAGLTLRSLDRNDGEVGSGATDENGLVTLPAPVWEPSRGPDIVNVIGDRDGDTVFGSTAWNAGGGYPYQRQLLGSVTTERPIYRPGETVYYQGVLRRDDGDRLVVPPSDPDATLVAQDARGRELLRRPVQLDEFGAFHGDLALDAEAPAGPYFMRLDLGRGVGGAAFSSFQVASFRRPEFAVTVAAARTDYDNGEQIAVTAGAELFLGAPLPDSAVRWRVTTTPLFFAPPGLPGYAFNDPDVRPHPRGVRRPPGRARPHGRPRRVHVQCAGRCLGRRHQPDLHDRPP
ncbi:MAG: Ig-like domain-containing protein, partial [Dehalococcoidia bacterium]